MGLPFTILNTVPVTFLCFGALFVGLFLGAFLAFFFDCLIARFRSLAFGLFYHSSVTINPTNKFIQASVREDSYNCQKP